MTPPSHVFRINPHQIRLTQPSSQRIIFMSSMANPRALVLLAPGFEEVEAITVIDFLRRASIEVVTAGTTENPITASRNTRHLADLALESALNETFSIIILPGGIDGTLNLKKDPRVLALLQKQRSISGWIGAICAAPTILVEHGLLSGEKLIGHPSTHASLPSEQLQPHARIVVDGKLITSLAAGSAAEFAYTIIEQLLGPEAVMKVQAGVCAHPATLPISLYRTSTHEGDEAWFTSVVRSIDDAVITTDNENIITFLNTSAEHLTAWPRDEAVGKPLSEVLRLVQAKTDATSTLRLEQCLLPRHSTETIPIELNLSAIRNHAGQIIGNVTIFRDIREKKAAANALLKSQEELRQAQKMEAVGRLAGGVAHDFNNILTAIAGFCEFALMNADEGSDLWNDLEEIRKSGERASALTRQLLTFSRRQTTNPKVLDLNSIVAEIDKMLRRLLPQGIQLVILTEPNLQKIKIDPGQLEQVLLNLVVNAKDAMSEVGKIVVRSSNVSISESEAGKNENPPTPGDYALLAVEDTGCGMSAEVKAKIFEPFFTTKGVGKGTGLGLSTVYGIVQYVHGHIGVDSTPGIGTCFNIYFPTTLEKPAEESEKNRSRETLCGAEPILVVDPDTKVRELIVRVLTDYGYKPQSAATSDEALKLAALTPPKLLVSELTIAPQGGRLLSEKLQKLYPGMKTLFVTGYGDDQMDNISVQFKPFSPAFLVRWVRDALDQ